MDYYHALAYVHLATIAPCFLIGAWLLLRAKGTPTHKLLGKAYVVLILLSSVVAAAMPAVVGPRVLNHFGVIHLFCAVVFFSIPMAIWSIRRGNVKAHAGYMQGVYIGGILVAGAFAFAPGRILSGWLYG